MDDTLASVARSDAARVWRRGRFERQKWGASVFSSLHHAIIRRRYALPTSLKSIFLVHIFNYHEYYISIFLRFLLQLHSVCIWVGVEYSPPNLFTRLSPVILLCKTLFFKSLRVIGSVVKKIHERGLCFIYILGDLKKYFFSMQFDLVKGAYTQGWESVIGFRLISNRRIEPNSCHVPLTEHYIFG